MDPETISSCTNLQLWVQQSLPAHAKILINCQPIETAQRLWVPWLWRKSSQEKARAFSHSCCYVIVFSYDLVQGNLRQPLPATGHPNTNQKSTVWWWQSELKAVFAFIGFQCWFWNFDDQPLLPANICFMGNAQSIFILLGACSGLLALHERWCPLYDC